MSKAINLSSYKESDVPQRLLDAITKAYPVSEEPALPMTDLADDCVISFTIGERYQLDILELTTDTLFASVWNGELFQEEVVIKY